MAVITMTAAAYGSPDGILVRQYQIGEAYTQDGPDGLMPSSLATSFLALGVASSAGGSVSGSQQTANNALLQSIVTQTDYPGYDTTPANV